MPAGAQWPGRNRTIGKTRIEPGCRVDGQPVVRPPAQPPCPLPARTEPQRGCTVDIQIGQRSIGGPPSSRHLRFQFDAFCQHPGPIDVGEQRRIEIDEVGKSVTEITYSAISSGPAVRDAGLQTIASFRAKGWIGDQWKRQREQARQLKTLRPSRRDHKRTQRNLTCNPCSPATLIR